LIPEKEDRVCMNMSWHISERKYLSNTTNIERKKKYNKTCFPYLGLQYACAMMAYLLKNRFLSRYVKLYLLSNLSI
jgi:hypothetical protein